MSASGRSPVLLTIEDVAEEIHEVCAVTRWFVDHRYPLHGACTAHPGVGKYLEATSNDAIIREMVAGAQPILVKGYQEKRAGTLFDLESHRIPQSFLEDIPVSRPSNANAKKDGIYNIASKFNREDGDWTSFYGGQARAESGYVLNQSEAYDEHLVLIFHGDKTILKELKAARPLTGTLGRDFAQHLSAEHRAASPSFHYTRTRAAFELGDVAPYVSWVAPENVRDVVNVEKKLIAVGRIHFAELANNVLFHCIGGAAFQAAWKAAQREITGRNIRSLEVDPWYLNVACGLESFGDQNSGLLFLLGLAEWKLRDVIREKGPNTGRLFLPAKGVFLPRGIYLPLTFSLDHPELSGTSFKVQASFDPDFGADLTIPRHRFAPLDESFGVERGFGHVFVLLTSVINPTLQTFLFPDQDLIPSDDTAYELEPYLLARAAFFNALAPEWNTLPKVLSNPESLEAIKQSFEEDAGVGEDGQQIKGVTDTGDEALTAEGNDSDDD